MHEPTPITLHRCGKTFADGTLALEPLDLEIGAGETVVLLGPSGCGKTTTLRIIAGLEYPDAGGVVMFGDNDVTPLPIERRGVTTSVLRRTPQGWRIVSSHGSSRAPRAQPAARPPGN